jgi:hypothetical protein
VSELSFGANNQVRKGHGQEPRARVLQRCLYDAFRETWGFSECVITFCSATLPFRHASRAERGMAPVAGDFPFQMNSHPAAAPTVARELTARLQACAHPPHTSTANVHTHPTHAVNVYTHPTHAVNVHTHPTHAVNVYTHPTPTANVHTHPTHAVNVYTHPTPTDNVYTHPTSTANVYTHPTSTANVYSMLTAE